jgi:hypothetical protein
MTIMIGRAERAELFEPQRSCTTIWLTLSRRPTPKCQAERKAVGGPATVA